VSQVSGTYRNPQLIWRSELHPERMPHPDPPPGSFTVTRSEIVFRPQGPAVHIWYAAVPAEPA
jgi:hypothetical protein